MGFLRRDDDDSQQAEPEPQQQQQSVALDGPAEAPHAAAYQAGSLAGIPESGRERIERMKKEVERGFFTSDLSINEFLLVKQSGFEPLGLVLGSSIYHIGFQQANWGRNQEMSVLTQAMYHARELAMTRMEEEADQLGADGVVGVRGRGGHVRAGGAQRVEQHGRALGGLGSRLPDAEPDLAVGSVAQES